MPSSVTLPLCTWVADILTLYGLGDKAVEVLDGCLANGTSRMRNYQRALVESGLALKAYDMGKIIDVDHAGDIEKAERFITTNS